MKAPTFLGRTSLSQDNLAGGAVPSSKELPLQVQRQEQTQWCWAATSSSVSAYFDGASLWSQCKVANSTLGRSDCCGAGASRQCNVPYYLDRALTTTGNYDRIAHGAETFSSLQGVINSDRPLCIRIQWGGNGGGHFLCIIGWKVADDGTKYYIVSDPIYERSEITERTLDGTYQGSGRWSHSFFVCAAPDGGTAVAAAAPLVPGTMGA